MVNIGESTLRLYYSTKVGGRSHICFIDLKEDTLDIVSGSRFALSPGDRGCFDHAGVMPSSIFNGYMYYSGWNLRRDVPYSHGIGMAKILPSGELSRQKGPILNVSASDPYLLNSPCVFVDGENLSMYYCSGNKWIDDFPCYSIKRATSLDGFNWRVHEGKQITFGIEDEAISRVCVDASKSVFYFSMKTKETDYKLFVSDRDGHHKKLEIESGFWDNQMQCYPFLYERNEYRYLFYNGNGYGATGIGVAKWTEDFV